MLKIQGVFLVMITNLCKAIQNAHRAESEYTLDSGREAIVSIIYN